MRLLYEPLTEVPANFTEVEYLESTGTQYINLNYIPTDTTGYKMGQIIPESNSRDNIIIGCRQATNTDSRFWQDIDWSSTNKNVGWGFGAYSPSGQRYSIVGKAGTYIVTSLNYMNDRSGKVDGVSYDTSLESKTLPEISRPMYLFAGNNGGTEGYYISTKIYFVQMTEGNKIVRDFVPCLDNNNVPCMYDKVEGKAYYNQGTGSFTYGRKIIPVEYLQSSGTQYVDSGYNMSDIRKIDMVVDWSAHTNTRREIMGSATSGGYSYEVSATGYYGLGASNYSTIQATGKDLLSWQWAGANTYPKLYINSVLGCTDTLLRTPVGTFKTAIAESYATNSKIYWFKIYTDNNVLVRDYIPCKDENNVAFMFDKVSHTVYLNVGTGDFMVGKTLPKKKLRFIIDSKRRVPKGFKEVEYLQSSGAQYIDTGITANGEFKAKYKIYIPTGFTNFIVGGARSSTQHLNFGQYETSGNFIMAYLGNYWTAGTPTTANSYFETEIDYKSGSQTGKVNGTSMLSGSYTGTEELNMNIYLFKRNFYGATDTISPFSGRIYYFKIWKDDRLVRDFIPCLDNNNVPCLWDRVEQKAYYNAGTGTFNYGHTITPVKYLQFNGNQYIQTNFNTTNATSFKYGVKFDLSSSVTNAEPRVISNEGTGSGKYFDIYYTTSADKLICRPPASGISLTSEKAVIFKYSTTVGKIQGYYEDDPNTLIYDSNATFTAPTIDINYRIGCRGNNAGSQYLWQGKIYYVYLERENLVCDFIPVKDENGVGYMLDRVSHTLYANAGTGSFIVGNEIKDVTRFLKGG